MLKKKTKYLAFILNVYIPAKTAHPHSSWETYVTCEILFHFSSTSHQRSINKSFYCHCFIMKWWNEL